MQPHYFYVKDNFKEGLSVERAGDFSNYRACGLRGYNYKNFGISLDNLDRRARSFPQLIEKTKRKRCDVFLARFEIFAGFKQTGTDYIALHNLGTAPMPGTSGDKFHMMISRNYAFGEELRDMINQGIAELKSSGQDKQMLSRYLR